MHLFYILFSFCADLLNCYQRFQKQLQSDSLALPEFGEIVDNTMKILNDLKSESIHCGFEKRLQNQMLREDDDLLLLNGIEIAESRRGRTIPQELGEFKSDTIGFLTESMKVRLQDEDRNLLATNKSFLNLDKKADIEKI